jgi:hypothetical protein
MAPQTEFRDNEKESFDHVNDNVVDRTITGSGSSQDNDHGFTPEEQRSIIRRIDYRLVTTVGAMYCVSLMDRTNLSAAAIAGMKAELSLSIGDRYVRHCNRRLNCVVPKLRPTSDR